MSESSKLWHPYTQAGLYPPPIHIVKAEGATLTDVDGKTYVDAISSWWVNIHGHSNALIAEAIYKQAKELEQVIFAGFTHGPAIELADNLVRITDAVFSKVFLSDNGSTAVEVALKMALQYHSNRGEGHRKTIVAFEGAYHGDTFGAMSIGSRGAFSKPFEKLLFDVKFIPVPNSENFETVKLLYENLLSLGNVAAFVFEPLIQGTAGMKMYKPEYLDVLIGIGEKHQVLNISDEVMTGFGRTGRLFAGEYLMETPDIICLSKGITGGFMPLGATMCKDFIYEAFHSQDRLKTFFHGHSYTGNPLACAAANASIHLLESSECRYMMKELSSKLTRLTDELQGKGYRNIRQLGLILAFEIGEEKDDGYFSGLRDRVYDFALESGVLLRPLGNTIYVMPPYVMNDEEFERVSDVLRNLWKII